YDEDAAALVNAGFTVAYRNNTLQPARALSFGELVTMVTPPAKVIDAYRRFVDSDYSTAGLNANSAEKYGLSPAHPYFIAFCVAADLEILDRSNSAKLSYKSPVTGELFAKIMRAAAPEYEFTTKPGKLLRKDVFAHIRRALLK
ncbi:MAG: hypothetical protein IJ299_02335, partial [Oscillospiraceae bacterium]|nr:hypothetical protein [Oscillospiraceae bacterium]